MSGSPQTETKTKLNSIEEAIEDIRQGKVHMNKVARVF